MPHPTSVSRQAGPAQLVLLLIGSCMPVLGAVLLSPVLPRMEDHFRQVPGAHVLVSVALTLPALLIAVGAPFAGSMTDRFDRKRLLIIAMAAYSIFGTAPLYLDSLYAILATRALVGVCEAAIMTCCTTLIADYWSGSARVRYLGLQTLITVLAATVFVLVAGVLGAGSWRSVFWLYAVAGVAAVPMVKLLWQPEGNADHGAQAAAPWPWRQIALPAVISLVGGMIFYTLTVQLAYVLDDAGMTSSAAIGGVTAIMSLATAVGAGLFPKLARIGARNLLFGEFVLTGAGLLLVFATGSVPVITAGALITGLGDGLLIPTLVTWAVGKLPFAQRGRGTGIWTGSLFLDSFFSVPSSPVSHIHPIFPEYYGDSEPGVLRSRVSIRQASGESSGTPGSKSPNCASTVSPPARRTAASSSVAVQNR